MPLVRRTRATLRRAEFGFFGVVVYTRVQTPRRWGEPFSAGVLFFSTLSCRPLRTSCWIVGTVSPVSVCRLVNLTWGFAAFCGTSPTHAVGCVALLMRTPHCGKQQGARSWRRPASEPCAVARRSATERIHKD